jgi:hypothetical protein
MIGTANPLMKPLCCHLKYGRDERTVRALVEEWWFSRTSISEGVQSAHVSLA